MNTFTCIGKGHGAPAIPATREDWEKMRRDPKLKEMCRRIAMGHEKVKRKLPIWTPGCAEFKNNHRAIKDALRPLPRLMLDFDEKGHSAEILQKAMELQKAGKWEILLVEESVRKGTHVLITLPEGMSPQEAQTRFSHDVGFQADPALKDIARCIYMVPEEYTLFVNERMFEVSPQSAQSPTETAHFVIQSEAKNLANTAQPLVDTSEILRRSAPLDDKNESGCTQTLRDAQSDKAYGNNENPCNPCHPCQKEETSTYPQTYEDIPYNDIVEVLEEQMGGRPDIGSRNNFIFSMACHLRYICNDDPSWIAQVLPTYGEDRDKFETTVRSACNRIQTKQMPRIMKRTVSICKQRMVEESEIRNRKSARIARQASATHRAVSEPYAEDFPSCRGECRLPGSGGALVADHLPLHRQLPARGNAIHPAAGTHGKRKELRERAHRLHHGRHPRA